jgi:signal transduction histidine kinase
VRLPEVFRTTTFRWTLAISGAFGACIVLMFGFVYWQTAAYMTERFDGVIGEVANGIVRDGPAEAARRLALHLATDPRRIKLGGLFDRQGHRLAGNIEDLPTDLPVDSGARSMTAVRVDALGREPQTARAVARRLSDGSTLVVGRDVEELTQFSRILEETLVIGLVPALALGLAAGVLLSWRGQRRLEEVNRRVQRIVAGDLRERLPTEGTHDPFDELALLVNRMLGEIEDLLRSVAGVGDDIAHDLRTPLTRVRVTLERARQNATTVEALRSAVDQAIAGLDQSLAIITALLRIAEIEHSRRLAGFRDVELGELAREVAELYEPIAEDKTVALSVAADGPAIVRGDRDLLFEAVANLVDNAVKFTPEGGRVELSVRDAGEQAVVRVSDSGPGIAAEEHELVGRRFYRSDKSRSNPGLGLGLSLVNAIAKLHGFRLTLSSGPGCIAEIAGPREPAGSVRH